MPTVCPMATPIAMGMGPATAETWEAITYASALTIGKIADNTPKPTDVSRAIQLGPSERGHPATVPDAVPVDYLTRAAR